MCIRDRRCLLSQPIFAKQGQVQILSFIHTDQMCCNVSWHIQSSYKLFSPSNLCRCCQAGCWWWPMPSRAMTSPLSARLRWTVHAFWLFGGFHLFNLDLPGHQHSVLKHPRLEEPLLQVCFSLALVMHALFRGYWFIRLQMERSVAHHQCRTRLFLFAASCIFLQLTFMGLEYVIGSFSMVVFFIWEETEKIVFLLQSCLYSARSLSWEKMSTFPPQRPGQRGWWWCRLRPDKLWGDSTVLRDLRAVAESHFCYVVPHWTFVGKKMLEYSDQILCSCNILTVFNGHLRLCRVF